MRKPADDQTPANFKGANVDFLEHLVRSVGALIGSEKGGAEGGGRRGLSGEERYFHDKGLNTGLCLLLLPPPAELRVDQRCTAEQMTGAKQRRRHFSHFPRSHLHRDLESPPGRAFFVSSVWTELFTKPCTVAPHQTLFNSHFKRVEKLLRD